MKHAFLIEAHNNWEQLKKLLTVLDDADNDIYVHIDKKSKDFEVSYFDNAASLSEIHFYQEYKVYWGGYSQIQVECLLMEKAYEAGKYSYYHIISGNDLSLKSNREIHHFFEKNQGMEFIDFNDEAAAHNPEIKRRTRLYHFLQNYRRRYHFKALNTIFTFAERVLLVSQLALGVNRVKNLDWTIKYGSNWVSITNDLVETILKQKDKIKQVFSWTNCADELFVQTIAYNCGFKDKIYKPQAGEDANLRCIDWKRGANGNPYTFRAIDYAMLKESRDLFARKFSQSVDEEIIDKVILLSQG